MGYFRSLAVTVLICAVSSSPASLAGESCLPQVLQQLLINHTEITEPVTPEKIKAALSDAAKRGLKPKTIITKAGKFIFYPTLAPFRLLQVTLENLDKHGKKALIRVPFEYLKQDGTTIVGFLLFNQLVGATPLQAAEYYVLPKNKNGPFEDATQTPPRKDGILVYVDAIPDDNTLAGYGESDFSARFSQRGGAYYLHVGGVKDMMQKLQALSTSTGQPIAELEILGHGLPGLIDISHEEFTGSQMTALKGYDIPFAKDATIRLQSCLLGANFKGDIGKPGETFMTDLGGALLNQGGTVMASNHTIYVTEHFPKSARKYREPWAKAYEKKALQPLDAAFISVLDALKSDDGPYRSVKIPGK